MNFLLHILACTVLAVIIQHLLWKDAPLQSYLVTFIVAMVVFAVDEVMYNTLPFLS